MTTPRRESFENYYFVITGILFMALALLIKQTFFFARVKISSWAEFSFAFRQLFVVVDIWLELGKLIKVRFGMRF